MSLSPERKKGEAFTLLEVLVTAVLVVLLIGLTKPLYSGIRSKAHKATCISHLRAFYGAFSEAIQDQGHWPQPPLDEGEWDENRYYQWWQVEMEKYGIGENVWICPADRIVLERKKRLDSNYFGGSYVPSHFGDSSSAPFRTNQPWMVERGTRHGKGSHILNADGAVTERINPFPGR